MPTRALGALLAAVAAVLFVVSIVTSAWWDGHPRVDGHVFTAKDVHIGLLGGEGCNTGGTGECQPLELGPTFTTAAYGELGAVGLATAFAILVAAAAWRISDSRKRIAKLGMIVAALAAAGAVALLVIGPQIKSSAKVEAPVGWGMLMFGGGIAAAIVGSIATMRVEREPLRLKTYAKPLDVPAYDVRELLREQHDGLRPSALGPEPMLGPGASGSLPGPAGPLGAPLVPTAPQLRPLYDVQGAVPAPIVPQLPQRAPTPIPRASAHQIAGLPTPPPELQRASSELQQTTPFLPPSDPFARPPSDPSAHPSNPFAQPLASELARQKPPTAPPPFVPAVAPYGNPPPRPSTEVRTKAASVPPPLGARNKPKTAPPPLRGRPPSVAPFANPALDRSKPASVAPPSVNDAGVDPLGKTVPAPGKQPRPSVPLPAKVPPAPKTAPLPTPTPSIMTSAPRPEKASRSSQPTLAHAVPPMPQIDTPPPQLRAPTDADDRLETALKETEIITAVEIDHEAKALYEEARRRQVGRAETASDGEPTGISDPPVEPRTTSEERAVIHDEGLASHAHGDVPGDDTDAIETAGRERVDADANDPPAPPPARPSPVAIAATPALAAAAAKPATKPAEPVKPPLSTAPASLPPPKAATLPASGPTPACPQCESPMAWVEEHLRFYCKSCRMYF